MVITEKQDYTNKVQALLQDANTYKVLNKHPTSRLKNKLIQTLKDIKQSGGISDTKYRKLYPTSAAPKVYGLPKIHKGGIPLRSIESSRGFINVWGGKGAGIHHQTLSWPVSPPPHKHTTFCSENPLQKVGTR